MALDNNLLFLAGNPPVASDNTAVNFQSPNSACQYNTSQIDCSTSSLPAEAVASEDYFSQTFTSSSLVSVCTVMSIFEKKLKGKSINESNVARLGVLLARCCFFGDDVMQQSTLKGKGSRHALEPHKLESLLLEIHKKAFSHISRDEFGIKIQPKIERALRDHLKPSRLSKNAI